MKEIKLQNFEMSICAVQAKTNGLKVTDDGPLSAATQTANDAGKETAGKVKKFFGLF